MLLLRGSAAGGRRNPCCRCRWGCWLLLLLCCLLGAVELFGWQHHVIPAGDRDEVPALAWLQQGLVTVKVDRQRLELHTLQGTAQECRKGR